MDEELNQKMQHLKVSEARYTGLRNQGLTCCLNSVLQALYMTAEFRDAVKKEESSTDLMFQLKELFQNLSKNKKSISTIGITQSLLTVNQQQDAVECFLKIINEVDSDALMVFQGTMTKTFQCLKQDHAEFHEETFVFIPLPIDAEKMDNYNVTNGFKAYFKPTLLKKEDWLYCDHCKDKSYNQTVYKMQKNPTVLILHLKRFIYDSTQMAYMKNSCQIDIPSSLKTETYEYNLYCVINHKGGCRNGHYTALIKPPDKDDWYCFNDEHVEKVPGKKLKSSQTAYILMYHKGKELAGSASLQAPMASQIGSHKEKTVKNKTFRTQPSRKQKGNPSVYKGSRSNYGSTSPTLVQMKATTGPLQKPQQVNLQKENKFEEQAGSASMQCTRPSQDMTTKNELLSPSDVQVKSELRSKQKGKLSQCMNEPKNVFLCNYTSKTSCSGNVSKKTYPTGAEKRKKEETGGIQLIHL
uniref:USP domain-containing protein n=1 Tax=Denticeps clupeoides TaxID=299321 RepID=A0AAY4A1W7_9TELE